MAVLSILYYIPSININRDRPTSVSVICHVAAVVCSVLGYQGATVARRLFYDDDDDYYYYC